MSIKARLRDMLRDATAQSHTRLDAVAGAVALDDAVDYAHFLGAHASVIFPLERRLKAAGIEQILPDWAQRTRSAALESDLRALRVHPVLVEVPPIAGEAALFGAAYVLEGSRLGAQFLVRRVPDSLPSDYLRHGQGRGLWPEFLLLLESSAEAQRDPDAAIAAALMVFGLFQDAFSRQPVAA